jgi:hypothetical protein
VTRNVAVASIADVVYAISRSGSFPVGF